MSSTQCIKFVEEILDEEDMSHGDYILNVTSGTPQCQAAMYGYQFLSRITIQGLLG